MMKKLFTLLIFITFSVVAIAQKNVSVFKVEPSDIVETDILSGKTVKLTIVDLRIIDGKTNVKFSSEEIKNTIIETMTNVCPKANFCENGNILIEIGIDRFDVRFTGAVWTGIVRYKVKVDSDEATIIEGASTRANIMGNKTGKDREQAAFDEANKKLLIHLQSLSL